jgi:hypothetical protein
MQGEEKKTSLQVSTDLRDRLYRLKFRKTYEQFLTELCDMYEDSVKHEGRSIFEPSNTVEKDTV